MRRYGNKVKFNQSNRPPRDHATALFRDRSHEALEVAIRRSEERECIRQQHGAVRIIMQDGRPGPDVGVTL